MGDCIMRIPLRARSERVRVYSTVDAEDYERATAYRWRLSSDGYAVGRVNDKTVALHRFLLGLSIGDGQHVHHRNHQRRDNRKANLEVLRGAEHSTQQRGRVVVPLSRELIDGDAGLLAAFLREQVASADPTRCVHFTARPEYLPPGLWERDSFIEAVDRWAAAHDGWPPSAAEWSVRTADTPSRRDAIRLFGSWSDGIEMAGFPRPESGGATRWAKKRSEPPQRATIPLA